MLPRNEGAVCAEINFGLNHYDVGVAGKACTEESDPNQDLWQILRSDIHPSTVVDGAPLLCLHAGRILVTLTSGLRCIFCASQQPVSIPRIHRSSKSATSSLFLSRKTRWPLPRIPTSANSRCVTLTPACCKYLTVHQSYAA